MATRSTRAGPAGKRTKQHGPAPASSATTPSPSRVPGAGPDDEVVGDLLRDLVVLTAANNLMAQTAFLTVERLRISTEVVDEAVTQDFGQQLYRQSEEMAEASSRLVLKLLDRVDAQGPEADALRDLIAMRRAFAERAGKEKEKPMEQRRLLESMERMYG